MAKTSTPKSRVQPRSTNSTGQRPAAKRHSARPKAEKPLNGPSRADEVFTLLSRPKGVSLEELGEAFHVQLHSARAYISVEARKRTGRKAVLREGRYYLG